MNKRFIAAVAAVLLGLTACTGPDVETTYPDPAPTAEAVQGEEGEIGIPDASAEPEPSVAAPLTLKMGVKQTVDAEGYKFSVEVIQYKKGAYANFQARVCNIKNTSGEPFSVSTYPWSIVYGDETADELSYEGPKPEYPDGRELGDGQCAKGWLSFKKVGGKEPSGVMYQGGGQNFTWNR